MNRFVNAASWQLASEFVRAYPNARIFHTHPGGGQYDVLAVLDDGLHIDINRTGSLHVHSAPRRGDAIPHDVWTRRLQSEPPRDVAQHLAAMVGLPWPDRRPSTKPHVLTYRLIAQALTNGLLDRQEWDATTQFYDSSGDDGSFVMPTPHPEITYLPANRVWILTADGTPHAWLWDGWAWLPNGDRRDLYAAYRSGRSLHDLVADLLRAPVDPKHRAPDLPRMPASPDQPIGSWP